MSSKFKIGTVVLVFVIVICVSLSIYFKFYKKDEVLVLYFSYNDYIEDTALEIQKELDADIFEIETTSNYSSSSAKWEQQAYAEYIGEEQASLRKKLPDLSKYDVIYIGYPIWFNDMPKIMYTVFDDYDFSGKVIRPFYDSEEDKGSWTVGEIMVLENKATVEDSLFINEDNHKKIKKLVKEWIS